MRKNTSRAFQATAAVAGVAALGMTFAGAAAADVLGGSSDSGSGPGYGTDNGSSYGTDNGSSGAGGLSDLSDYRLGNLGLSGFKMPTSNEIGDVKVPGIGESDKGNHDGTLQLLGNGYGGKLHTSSNDSGGLGGDSSGGDSSGGDSSGGGGLSDGGSGSHDSSGLNGLGNGSHEGKSKSGSSSRDGGSGGLSGLMGGLGGDSGSGGPGEALSGHQFGS